MTHRRRLTRGPRPPQGYVPVTVVASEKRTPTVVIPAVTPEPPASTEVIKDSLDAAGGPTVLGGGTFAQWAQLAGQYEQEPVPDLDSPDPADRTAWFEAKGGEEPLFRALVAELDAMWLLDTSLPVPPRKSGTTDPSPEAIPPPAGAPTASGASELVNDTASVAPRSGDDRDASAPDATEAVPAEDEPAAEHDCGEGSEA